MSMNMMAIGLPGGIEWIVILLISAVLPLVFWKICSKAGFPGALGLLIIFPVLNVILLLYLAFAEWPALKNTAQ